MIARQHDQAAGSLRHHVVQVERQRAHHDAADEDAEIAHGRPARRCDQFAERHAHRRPERFRLLHRAADGKKSLGHRLALRGLVHVVQRLHVRSPRIPLAAEFRPAESSRPVAV